MRDKITFKDKMSYLLKIMEGKFTPFLQNELNDEEIKKVFFGLQNLTDDNDYKKLLHNYLNKYYESNRDIYLTNSGRDAQAEKGLCAESPAQRFVAAPRGIYSLCQVGKIKSISNT